MTKKDQRGSCEKVRVSGVERRKIDKLNYLEVMIRKDDSRGRRLKEVAQMVLDGRKVWRKMV